MFPLVFLPVSYFRSYSLRISPFLPFSFTKLTFLKIIKIINFFRKVLCDIVTSPVRGGGGEISKILKRGWKYGAGAGFLKRERVALFLFNFFKVYHSYI